MLLLLLRALTLDLELFFHVPDDSNQLPYAYSIRLSRVSEDKYLDTDAVPELRGSLQAQFYAIPPRNVSPQSCIIQGGE